MIRQEGDYVVADGGDRESANPTRRVVTVSSDRPPTKRKDQLS